MPIYQPLEERFHSKYTVDEKSGCWMWTAAINEKGYGMIGLPRTNKISRAHRVSWELHNGKIPVGLFVLHKCDTPLCVNPEHLFIGTLKDNSQDMVSKGRGVTPDNRGERATWHKLTEAQALDCMTRRMSARKFAEMYGVSRSAVQRIWEGKNWRHLRGNS